MPWHLCWSDPDKLCDHVGLGQQQIQLILIEVPFGPHVVRMANPVYETLGHIQWTCALIVPPLNHSEFADD